MYPNEIAWSRSEDSLRIFTKTEQIRRKQIRKADPKTAFGIRDKPLSRMRPYTPMRLLGVDPKTAFRSCGRQPSVLAVFGPARRERLPIEFMESLSGLKRERVPLTRVPQTACDLEPAARRVE